MKLAHFVCLALACSVLRGEPTAPAAPLSTPPAAIQKGGTPEARKTIEHDGQTFELASSSSTKTVQTDEYVLAGEKITDWTQLVTVQRLSLGKPTATDDFLAYFQKRLQTEDGASLDILKQAKAASVFVVRFPKSDRNEEQVMICLAFTDSTKPGLLNIIQYAIKPMRASVDVVQLRIKSWRDKLMQQADALNPPS